MTQIKDLIANNLTIPTIPAVVTRVTALVDDPDSGTAEIGELVSQDAPLAAKVLRIANSAYYGLSGECVSTEQASTVLGVRVLRNIVTQVAVMQQFEHLAGTGFDVEALWKHSTVTGHLCSFLASRAKRALELTRDEFYVCGLLHDVGKIVMLDGLGADYAHLSNEATRRGIPIHAAERRRFGFTHTDVGAVVATRWGLPAAVSLAIQHHHSPAEELAKNPVAAVVADADLVVHAVAAGQRAAATRVFDDGTGRLLGLVDDDINAVLDYTEESLQSAV